MSRMFDARLEEEILEAAKFCKEYNLPLKGIHFHQGSNFRDPEPLITEDGVIVPEFLIMRGQQRAYLVIADSKTSVEALVKPLKAFNGRNLIVVATEAEWAKHLATLPAIVVPHVGEPSARMLARALPAPALIAEMGESKWQRLQRLMDTEGFVDDTRLADVLHCPLEDVAGAVRGWRPEQASYLPGIGLCSNETVQELRSMLQSGLRQAA